MFNKNLDQYPGIRKYLKGRIGANPFFGNQAKHAVLGFLDYVIIPSTSLVKIPGEKIALVIGRLIIPFDLSSGVRKKGVFLSRLLIKNDSIINKGIWEAIKSRVLDLMSNLDSLPALNRIPIQKALSRLPVKIFAIQIHSALKESYAFDKQVGLENMEKFQIPVLIIKSEKDAIAKYVPKNYDSPIVQVLDVTNNLETNLFREHLYHMVHPIETGRIIDDFISKIERKNG